MGENRGRPRLFKSRKELCEKIDSYFDSVGTHVVTDSEGNAVFDKRGQPVMREKIPTVTGLARHLGMNSRQTLINYKNSEKFGDIVSDAKMRIEEYAEERLYDRDGQRGAEFNLRCNFGWGKEAEEQNQNRINEGMIALAELIKTPMPNRNIADFEGNDDE